MPAGKPGPRTSMVPSRCSRVTEPPLPSSTRLYSCSKRTESTCATTVPMRRPLRSRTGCTKFRMPRPVVRSMSVIVMRRGTSPAGGLMGGRSRELLPGMTLPTVCPAVSNSTMRSK